MGAAYGAKTSFWGDTVGTTERGWLHSIGKILNATVSRTLKWFISCYVNCTSAKQTELPVPEDVWNHLGGTDPSPIVAPMPTICHLDFDQTSPGTSRHSSVPTSVPPAARELLENSHPSRCSRHPLRQALGQARRGVSEGANPPTLSCLPRML